MAQVHSIDSLLENATWLQGLAAQMLADRGLAEDAVQETWVAALSGKRPPENERGWLARVVRNFALQRGRSEAARRERERSVARPERSASTGETVARAELHAKLVQAVLALDEPYRTTILWRYFEGLSAEEIALRARIDPATVRSRVARAREKLRAALMAGGGEPPERWLSALLPIGSAGNLGSAATSAALAGFGGSLMGAKLVLGLSALGLIAAVLIWRTFDGAEPARPMGVTSAAVLEEPEDRTREPARESAFAPDATRAAVEVDASSGPRDVKAVSTWRGVVLSEDGRVPLAGARVSYRKGSETDERPDESSLTREGTRTDSRGEFALAISEQLDDGLWFEADGHFAHKLSAGDLPRDRESPIEVVLAPLGRIELEIVDDALAPHVELPVRYSIEVNRGSQDFMWSYRRDFAAGRTDPAGRLTIFNVPCGMQIDLREGERSFSAHFLGIVSIDPRERVLRHQVKLARTATIIGRLRHDDGRPAAGFELEWQSYPLDYDQPLRATAGSDGAFTISSVQPKLGELRWNLAGFEPLELSPSVGELIDVGEIVLPSTVELSGRLTSRWLSGADFERALDGVSVRVLRGGRTLAPLISDEGAIALRAGNFITHVTEGPLEVLVTRGGSWFYGTQNPSEVLASVNFAAPSAGLELPIDAHLGALDVDFGDFAPAEGEIVKLRLFARERTGPARHPFTATAAVRAAHRARFAPLTPGRYRATIRLPAGRECPLGELEIRADDATQISASAVSLLAMIGSVRTAGGVPVHNASVDWRGAGIQGTTTSDAEGLFRIAELASGTVDLFVRHGDHGVEIRRGIEVFAPLTEVDIVLAGFASVVGRVSIDGRPAALLPIGAQPVNSNDTYSAITDDEGVFRIERLPACRLRVWSSKRFVEVIELAAGETRELSIELGGLEFVTFVRDGVPLEDLHGVRALGLANASSGQYCWHAGDVRRGGAELDLPDGRTLFDVSRARSGSNTCYVAIVDRAQTEVELARHTLVLDCGGAWRGVLPRANLVSIDGDEIVSMWGGEIVLAVERDADGRAVIPCLPDGARVRITGFDSRGARHEMLVDVPATSVRWP